jgi:hypothetical protein
MYNMNVINPAYAGSKESISWVFFIETMGNIEDAPTSLPFLDIHQ